MKIKNIKWDCDDPNVNLPTEVNTPYELMEEEEISDWLSDTYGYCHFGFELQEDREFWKYKERIEFLKAMHLIVCSMNNEYAYEVWISEGVPDAPSDEDYEYIADNKEIFMCCVSCFERVMKRYAKDGLFVGYMEAKVWE